MQISLSKPKTAGTNKQLADQPGYPQAEEGPGGGEYVLVVAENQDFTHVGDGNYKLGEKKNV